MELKLNQKELSPFFISHPRIKFNFARGLNPWIDFVFVNQIRHEWNLENLFVWFCPLLIHMWCTTRLVSSHTTALCFYKSFSFDVICKYLRGGKEKNELMHQNVSLLTSAPSLKPVINSHDALLLLLKL